MKTYDRPIAPDYFCDLSPSCGKFNDHKGYVAKFSGFKESSFYEKKAKKIRKYANTGAIPGLLPYHLVRLGSTTYLKIEIGLLNRIFSMRHPLILNFFSCLRC